MTNPSVSAAPIENLTEAVQVVLDHIRRPNTDPESVAWFENDKVRVIEDFGLTPDSELGLLVLNYGL